MQEAYFFPVVVGADFFQAFYNLLKKSILANARDYLPNSTLT